MSRIGHWLRSNWPANGGHDGPGLTVVCQRVRGIKTALPRVFDLEGAPPAIFVGGTDQVSLTDRGAIARGAPNILFYQVRGVCGANYEGP